MKKIAYIGHSFHQKTKSTQFLVDILLQYYKVDFYWTLPLSYKSDFNLFGLDEKEYDALIFFQIMPTIQDLKYCKCRNIILIPMFDNDLKMNLKDWAEYRDYKFINFSKTLYNKLNFLNFTHNKYIQYAPVPIAIESKISNTNKKPKLFFWQRSNHINWNLIKELINLKQIDSIHLHRIESDFAKDQWFEMPSKDDIEKYNITLSSWFESKEELIKVINDCDIFVVPRLFEGIGQTFLEAMALGKCVISPDFPTMNEYITNDKNGKLFDYLSPSKIDLSNWQELGINAKSSIQQINNQWGDMKYSIIDFIDINSNKELIIPNNKYLDNFASIIKDKKYSFIAEDFKIGFLPNNVDSKSMHFSKYLNILIDFLSKNINQNEQYIIYGTGTGAKIISCLIPSDCISYYVDIDEEKQQKQFCNKIVYSPQKLLESNTKIIISIFGRYEKIAKFLEKEFNIDKSRLISLDF